MAQFTYKHAPNKSAKKDKPIVLFIIFSCRLLIITRFIINSTFHLNNYNSWIYSGLISMAATIQVGNSTRMRFTRDPRMVSRRPS